MRLDCHIHTGIDVHDYNGTKETEQALLLGRMKECGIDGGVILSVDPLRYPDWSTEKRIEDVKEICKGVDTLFPFYWINPLESDALAQVDQAVDAGIMGFKLICSEYMPGDQKCMDVLERIAQKGKPALFHSGILWDGMPSANNNRPSNFEALLEIPKLRFCLAHMSWPWYDECFAVYGKFNNAYYRNPNMSCEMFIDVTPGTPRPWREEAYKHLFWSEYEYRYNLMFGSDCRTSHYNVSWVKEWMERDDALWAKYVEKDLEDWKDHVYEKNLMRFLGLSDENPTKYIPMVAE